MNCDYAVIPFESPEEAWLWCCRIRLGGRAGKEVCSDFVRPCETIDIYHIIQKLYKRSILSDSHLKVMVDYGERLAPPLSFKRIYDYECSLWDQAMERLASPLREKKIVLFG